MPVTFKCPKPIVGSVLEPVSLGEHLRNWRLKAGLFQKDVAAKVGADPISVLHWERGKTAVETRFHPAIIALLGYNPLPEAETPGGQVTRARMSQGLSKRALAALAGIDETTVTRIEDDIPSPQKAPMQAVRNVLQI